GVTFTRDTNPATSAIGAGPNGSGPATKTHVDANITIAPTTATNDAGANHTFTVTVKRNLGGGDGFVNAPDGTKPTVTLTNGNGATDSVVTNTGANPGTTAGQCSVTFASNTTGNVVGNASVTLTVGGISITRDTNPATATIGSGPGGSGP